MVREKLHNLLFWSGTALMLVSLFAIQSFAAFAIISIGFILAAISGLYFVKVKLYEIGISLSGNDTEMFDYFDSRLRKTQGLVARRK